MADRNAPRCVNCWAPLRRDSEQWVSDEALSRPYCGLPSRAHEPMDEAEREAWAASNV